MDKHPRLAHQSQRDVGLTRHLTLWRLPDSVKGAADASATGWAQECACVSALGLRVLPGQFAGASREPRPRGEDRVRKGMHLPMPTGHRRPKRLRLKLQVGKNGWTS